MRDDNPTSALTQTAGRQQLRALPAVAIAYVWAGFSGCESPGHDLPDAYEDTKTVIDVVIAGGDLGTLSDANTDAGGSGIDWTGPGTVVELDVFAKAIAKWECQRIIDCSCTSPKGTKPDLASCMAQQAPLIVSAWSNGGLGVREDLLPVCVAALEAQSAPCDVAKIESVSACRAALRWPAKEGGKCGTSSVFLCADGSLCEKGVCSTAHLSIGGIGSACSSPLACGDAACIKGANGKGTCQVPVPPGGPCTLSAECAPPATCQVPGGQATGVCTLAGKKGTACTSTSQCAPGLGCIAGGCAAPATCTAGAPCGNGGHCLGAIHNKCLPRVKAGGACKADSECVDTSYCDGLTKVCTARPAQNSGCGNGTACASGLGCDVDKQTCQPLPTKGQKCALGPDGPAVCATGLGCVAATLLCDALPGENAPCTASGTCSDADVTGDGKGGDLVCHSTFTGNVCKQKLAKGAPCDSEVCMTGLHCESSGGGAGKCASTLGNGQTCQNTKQCNPGSSCVPNSANKLVCGAMPKLSESCLAECASSLYCDQGAATSACQPPICTDLFTAP